jgi:heterodisulfide reductase subunit B
MNIGYYPGCTLKTKSKNLEDSALAAMAALGVNLVELQRWNCCGTVYSLADDDLVHHLAPLRNLIRVNEEGYSKVATLCSFCYNTLQRVNLLVRNDPEKRKTLNSFLEEEEDYAGEVEVVHLLEILRDDVGWEKLSEQIKVPLHGLKLAPYYGCTLLRPDEVAIDYQQRPTILQELLQTLGAEAVDFPAAARCCGSYQIVSNPEFALDCAWNVLSSALRSGSEALVTSCPLCDYNLSQTQEELAQRDSEFRGMPILYFTQLLALALGLGPEACRFDLNYIDPIPLLRSKGLLNEKYVPAAKR